MEREYASGSESPFPKQLRRKPMKSDVRSAMARFDCMGVTRPTARHLTLSIVHERILSTVRQGIISSKTLGERPVYR